MTGTDPCGRPADCADGDDRLTWASEVADRLAALPFDQARALRMCYAEHRSCREIADQLGVAALQARTILADALCTLGRTLVSTAAETDRSHRRIAGQG